MNANANPAAESTSLMASPRFTSLAICRAALAPRYLNTRLANNVPGISEIKPPISKEYALTQSASKTTANVSSNKKNS